LLLSFSVWLAIFLSSAPIKPRVYSPPPTTYTHIEKHFSDAIKRGLLVGGAVVVIKNGRVDFIGSFGHRKKGEPARVDDGTIFQLGSLSKPVTASLFAAAIKQKRLSLDTPLKTPKITLPHIRARHLLSHTAGFNRAGWNWQIEHGTTRDQLLERLKKATPVPPGEKFDYHNFAFSLVEEIIAQAFQSPFKVALRTHLFAPLGMTRTSIGMSDLRSETNRAWPHEPTKQGRFQPSSDYSYRYHDSVASAAGVNASIKDVAKFLQLQLGQFPTVASAADLQAFWTPVIFSPDAQGWFKNRLKGPYECHYGYGWRLLLRGNDTLVFHGGWLKGFRNFMVFNPKTRNGVCVLSNTESNFAFYTALKFLELD
jgi:beta-lactamase class C